VRQALSLSLRALLRFRAGTGDNTEIVGQGVNRAAKKYPRSAVFAVAGSAVLASGETLTLKNVSVEHDSASNFATTADLKTFADAVVATGPSGGGTVHFCKEYEADLSGAKQYVRLMATPDLSRTGTDTFNLSGVGVLGGQDVLPA